MTDWLHPGESGYPYEEVTVTADREPSTEALSAEEEAEFRARHKPQTEEQLARYGPACFENGERCMADCKPWPCDTVRLLATLDREREVRSDLARQVAGLPLDGFGPRGGWTHSVAIEEFRAAVLAIAGTDATPEPDR